MQPIPKSGYYYTNRFTRIALDAYEGMIGKNGLNAILNLAGLSSLIDHYPPDDLERQFDFADFTAIHIGLEEMYGPRGGRGLALRAGRATFNDALKNIGAMAGIADPAFKILPLLDKVRICLPTVNESDSAFIWTIHRCPICWTRQGADNPVCSLSTGLLQAMLTWVSDGLEFQITESKCCAVGDTVCEFVIPKGPIS
jgi:predicted hydrocarbon binding protein